MINGLHHVTALASDAQQNLDFYTGVLGLRMVKKTVNFDDPTAYHLYYGDGAGSPGTNLTFFPYGHIMPGKRGKGETASITFTVPAGSLPAWKDRLAAHKIVLAEETTVFGQPTIAFLDPDQMRIEMTEETDPTRRAVMWENAPLSADMTIVRISGVTLTPAALPPIGDLVTTEDVLEGFLGFTLGPTEGNRTRFFTGESFVDVVRDSEMPPMRSSAGTIHHVAFRNADDAVQVDWRQKLIEKGFHVSPVMDRTYFHSIYFREPGGVLFEFATDGPGMDVDEDIAALGEALRLPPMYEDRRDWIESRLPSLVSAPKA